MGWQRLGNGAGRDGMLWGQSLLPSLASSIQSRILGQGRQDHPQACVSLNSWISLFVTVAEAVVFGKIEITLRRAAWSRRHGDHGKAVVVAIWKQPACQGASRRQTGQTVALDRVVLLFPDRFRIAMT